MENFPRPDDRLLLKTECNLDARAHRNVTIITVSVSSRAFSSTRARRFIPGVPLTPVGVAFVSIIHHRRCAPVESPFPLLTSPPRRAAESRPRDEKRPRLSARAAHASRALIDRISIRILINGCLNYEEAVARGPESDEGRGGIDSRMKFHANATRFLPQGSYVTCQLFFPRWGEGGGLWWRRANGGEVSVRKGKIEQACCGGGG